MGTLQCLATLLDRLTDARVSHQVVEARCWEQMPVRLLFKLAYRGDVGIILEFRGAFGLPLVRSRPVAGPAVPHTGPNQARRSPSDLQKTTRSQWVAEIWCGVCWGI
jgi:hypothetical protein